jgi:phenylacetate-CoA ligase
MIVSATHEAEERSTGSLPRSSDQVSFLQMLEERSSQLGCDIFALPRSAQDDIALMRLRDLYHEALSNPRWAQWAKDQGGEGLPAEIANFDDWQRLPIMDKVSAKVACDLNSPRLLEGGFGVVASGGTSSGVPSQTLYTKRELSDTYKLAGRFMGQHVTSRYLRQSGPKWIITTLGDYQLWSSGTMVGGVLKNIPGCNFLSAGPCSAEVFRHFMNYEGPKVIMGVTQSIASLPYLGLGLDLAARRSFKIAMYGSGILSDGVRAELKQAFPDVAILSYFAATQAEAIGLQQDEHSKLLTAVPGLHLIEIVDGNGRWVAEGEEGELVVTRLHAEQLPVLRYKLGDRAIRRPDIISHQLVAQQFEFVGRSGDIIHLDDQHYSATRAMENLLNTSVEKLKLDLKSTSRSVQFANDRSKKVLELLLEVPNGGVAPTPEQVHAWFTAALGNSLSMFNELEANASAVARSGYRFQLSLVPFDSSMIYRTSVGKTPLVRDQF